MFQIKKGKIKKPHFLLIYGLDGIGKTTFASEAPNPLFIDVEEGSNFLDVARYPMPENWKQLLQMIDQAGKEKQETIVLDSIDRIEIFIFEEVCRWKKKDSINDIGYAKGFEFALEYWRDLIKRLKVLRNTKNIIIIGHDHVKTFNDPQSATDYDRHQLRIHHKAASLWREEVDAVLFATYKVAVRKEDDQKKGKAIQNAVRVLRTERRPGFDAKNRIGLPYEIELSWSAFIKEANKGDAENCEVLLSQINGLLPDIKDPEAVKKATEYIKANTGNPTALKQILNRLNKILEDSSDE